MCLSLFPVWACMSLKLCPCLPLSTNYVNSFGLHIPLIILLCVSPACLLPSLCEIVCVLLFPVLLWQCRVLCSVCIVLLPLCCQSNLSSFVPCVFPLSLITLVHLYCVFFPLSFVRLSLFPLCPLCYGPVRSFDFPCVLLLLLFFKFSQLAWSRFHVLPFMLTLQLQ